VSHGCPFAVAHKSIGKKLKKEKEGSQIDRIFSSPGQGRGRKPKAKRHAPFGAAMNKKQANPIGSHQSVAYLYST